MGKPDHDGNDSSPASHHASGSGPGSGNAGPHQAAESAPGSGSDEPPDSTRPPPSHTLSPLHLARILETDLQTGLSRSIAAERLARDGENKVDGAKGLSMWQIALRQISNSLAIVLLTVMVLSFAIHDYLEAGVILAVILLNVVVG